MKTTAELLVTDDGERVTLAAPGVGLFTCALPPGRIVVAGEPVGELRTLGVSQTLVVPSGTNGRITNALPERVHEPVEYGQALYTLEPIDTLTGDASLATDDTSSESGAPGADGLLVRSPYAGRFWMRPGPGEPAFAEQGGEVADGQPLGWIEIMKTFAHVTYRAGGELPARARIVEFLVTDGAEVSEGTPLVRVEAN